MEIGMGAEIGVLNDDAVYLISEEDKYEPMKLIVRGIRVPEFSREGKVFRNIVITHRRWRRRRIGGVSGLDLLRVSVCAIISINLDSNE